MAAASLGGAPPVCATAFETRHLVCLPPTPTPLRDKTIALIDIHIARGPGLPSTHSRVCHTADQGFGVCSAVVQGWSWGIVFIECDRLFYTLRVWKIYFSGSKRLVSNGFFQSHRSWAWITRCWFVYL